MLSEREIVVDADEVIMLKEDERIDDLQRNGYRIIQNPKKFCFGMDAVLLSGFAGVKEGGSVLDMADGRAFNCHPILIYCLPVSPISQALLVLRR